MGDPIGALANRANTGGGLQVDPAARRAAISEALLRTGAGLTASAGRPDADGGGFGAIAPALLSGMSGMRERFAEADALARQKRDEEQRHRLFEEQLAEAKQSRELAEKGEARAGEQFGWAREDRTREEGERGAVAAGAADMVRVIEADAGADSPEARQARALATLGSKADMGRLAALHAEVVARKRQPGDEEASYARKRSAEKADIAAGVAPDPVAQQRLQERQAAAYERQVSMAGRGGTGGVLFERLSDDIRSTEDSLYRRLEAEAKAKIGDNPVPKMEPDGKGGLQPVFPQVDFEGLRRRARVEALKTEYGRRGISLAPVEQILGFQLQNDRFIEIALQGLAANQDPALLAQQIREAREAFFRAQKRR